MKTTDRGYTHFHKTLWETFSPCNRFPLCHTHCPYILYPLWSKILFKSSNWPIEVRPVFNKCKYSKWSLISCNDVLCLFTVDGNAVLPVYCCQDIKGILTVILIDTHNYMAFPIGGWVTVVGCIAQGKRYSNSLTPHPNGLQPSQHIFSL